MTEIASVFQIGNLGVESTPGTAVAANKRLTGLMIRPTPKTNFKTYMGQGYKFPVAHTLNKEWLEWDLQGPITYTEIVYLLSSLITTVTPVLGTAAYTWTFSTDVDGPDTPKTYTLEWGDSNRAMEAAHSLVTGLTLTFTRDSCDLKGTMIANALSDAITLTGSPTEVALVPVMPPQVAVYLEDTAAALSGATALTKVVSVEWAFTGKYKPTWFLNQSLGWNAHVEAKPTFSVKLKMEKDATGMGVLSSMRNAATKFLRVQAEGPVIAGAEDYVLTIDSALKVDGDPRFTVEDELECVEWTMTGFYDPTWTKAMQVAAINALSSL